MSVSLREAKELAKEFSITLPYVYELEGKTVLFGKTICSVRDLLQKYRGNELYFKPMFADVDLMSLYTRLSGADYEDELLEGILHQSLRSFLAGEDISELSGMSTIRCLRLTGTEPDALIDLMQCKKTSYLACVRYNNFSYYLTMDNILTSLDKATKIRSANRDIAVSEKVISPARVVSAYAKSVYSKTTFSPYSKVLNFGTWLLGYLSSNYYTSSSCIVLNKSTEEARLCVTLSDFIDYINVAFANKISGNIYKTDFELMPKYTQYGKEYDSVFAYYLDLLGLSNINILSL